MTPVDRGEPAQLTVVIVFIFGIFINVDGATVTLALSGLGVDLSGIDFGLRMAGGLFAALSTIIIIIYALFAEQFAPGDRRRTLTGTLAFSSRS